MRERWPAMVVVFGLGLALVGGLLFLGHSEAPPPSPVSTPVPPQQRTEAGPGPTPVSRADLPLGADDTDVLLLALCTLRRDRMGLYGHDRNTTPFIDRLGAEGVVFDQHFAQAPWTRPSMGALFTGKTPRALGLDAPNRRNTDDLLLGTEHTLLAEHLAGAGYRAAGAVANPNVGSIFGFDQGFSSYLDPEGRFRDKGQAPLAKDIVDALLAQAQATPEDQRLYLRGVIVDTHRRPMFAQKFRDEFESGRRGTYDAALRTVDDQIHRLVDGLLKRRPNLLLVLAADHGEGLNHPKHHGPEHGNFVYRTTVHTPWLIWHPSLQPRRVASPTMNIDVVPTVLDLLGLPAGDAHGRSQAAELRDPAAPTTPRTVFAETFFRKIHRSTAYDGAFQLIRTYESGAVHGPHSDQLFAAADWQANTDLAATEPQALAALQADLDAWEAEQARFASPSSGQPQPGLLDPTTEEALRVLGYRD